MSRYVRLLTRVRDWADARLFQIEGAQVRDAMKGSLFLHDAVGLQVIENLLGPKQERQWLEDLGPAVIVRRRVRDSKQQFLHRRVS